MTASDDTERQRRERLAFDAAAYRRERWFALRLVAGYASILLLAATAAVSSYVILCPERFSTATTAVDTKRS